MKVICSQAAKLFLDQCTWDESEQLRGALREICDGIIGRLEAGEVLPYRSYGLELVGEDFFVVYRAKRSKLLVAKIGLAEELPMLIRAEVVRKLNEEELAEQGLRFPTEAGGKLRVIPKTWTLPYAPIAYKARPLCRALGNLDEPETGAVLRKAFKTSFGKSKLHFAYKPGGRARLLERRLACFGNLSIAGVKSTKK